MFGTGSAGWVTVVVCCCRNTEVLQEQLHAAHTRAEMAEQRAAEADGLSLQLNQLQSHQQTWDKVLQVQHSEMQKPWSVSTTLHSNDLWNGRAGSSRCTNT